MSAVDGVMQEVKINNFPLTEAGNAEMLADLYGDKLRYDRRKGRWNVWSGVIWKPEYDDLTVKKMALEIARLRQDEISKLPYSEGKPALLKKAAGFESKQKIEAVAGLAKMLEPIKDDGDNWDKNPWLFACQNGVIDLMTGTLREGRPEDRITLCSPINYNPCAPRERWEQFMDEAFEGNDELIHFVQKTLGYSLTGDMREQKIFPCYGQGGNGKSKLFDIIRYVMGSYAKEAAASTFYKVYNRNNDFELPALEGIRLITVAENNESSALDTQRIKRFSGGDPVTAAEKHKNEITYQPAGKLWLYFNTKPAVLDATEAMWQRVCLIPFLVTFRGTEREDKNLLPKLMKEAEGILAWLMEGCLMWQQEGLKPIPSVVSDGVSEYQRENDKLADFLYECVEEVESSFVAHSELFGRYIEWAKKENLQPKEILTTSNRFGRELSGRLKKGKGQGGNARGYVGIKLRRTDFTINTSLERTDNSQFSVNTQDDITKDNNLKTPLNLSDRHKNQSVTSKNLSIDEDIDKELNAALADEVPQKQEELL